MIILILLTLIYAVIGQPCCSPLKWHGVQESTNGVLTNGSTVPIMIKNLEHIYFDTTRKMITMDGYSETESGTRIHSVYIQDYNTNITYTIALKQCTKGSIILPFPGNCLPDDSKLVRTGYSGTGTERINVRYYQYNKYGLTAVVGVDSHCFAVDSTYYGIFNNDYTIGFTRYSNVTFGIDDESVFEIPDICKQTHSNVIVDPIGKRSVRDSILGRV